MWTNLAPLFKIFLRGRVIRRYKWKVFFYTYIRRETLEMAAFGNFNLFMNENNKMKNYLWSNMPLFRHFDTVSNWTWDLVSASGKYAAFLNFYLSRLLIPFSSATSIFGFLLLLSIALQLLSGFFLGWYYIPEPGLVVELREEMFEETRYGFEVFSMHVRGVDVIFVLSYFHILKKLYLKNYVTCDSEGWMLGGYAFFWFHYIVGLGICLSASHLSDLTLTIAANVYWSLVNNIHKSYYFVFTNRHLNVDELMRLMVLHYFTPWYYLYLVKTHIMFCHEGWDSDSDNNTHEDKNVSWASWFYDAFWKEIQDSWHILLCTYTYFWLHHFDITSVAYFFFERWNISELDEMRFYGVAPHWYFRPLMGLLTIAPTHFEGIMWLGLFFVTLSCAPLLYSLYNSNHKFTTIIPTKFSKLQTILFYLFMLSLYTTASILPCGRYYYDPEGGYIGNTFLKWSYQYIYWYLGWIIHHIDRIDEWLINTARYVKYHYFKTNPKMKSRWDFWDWTESIDDTKAKLNK